MYKNKLRYFFEAFIYFLLLSQLTPIFCEQFIWSATLSCTLACLEVQLGLYLQFLVWGDLLHSCFNIRLVFSVGFVIVVALVVEFLALCDFLLRRWTCWTGFVIIRHVRVHCGPWCSVSLYSSIAFLSSLIIRLGFSLSFSRFHGCVRLAIALVIKKRGRHVNGKQNFWNSTLCTACKIKYDYL